MNGNINIDTYTSKQAVNLLNRKSIYMFGDSNVRAIYKDFVWLFKEGTLIPEARLKKKNELSHSGDERLSNGRLHGGRNYEEVRRYTGNPIVYFQFVTRLYQTNFRDTIETLGFAPDVIIINSCVWDLSRWGSHGTEDFKRNVIQTFQFLRNLLPTSQIVWLTTLPPSFTAEGGFLTEDIIFLRNSLPWQVAFANSYVAEVAAQFKIDIVDLHYYFVYLLHLRSKDGIHWQPKAVRFATNLILTHLSNCWNRPLSFNME